MENILRMRLDEMAKTQRLRESRRKASERRRARGWKSEKGRWLRICERDGFTCWICRQPINPDIQLNRPMSGTADHVIPLAAGGPDTDDNLRPAHLSCNSRRQHCANLPALIEAAHGR
jgi:5-methylcytosine-specific restriction endonuclease McrA